MAKQRSKQGTKGIVVCIRPHSGDSPFSLVAPTRPIPRLGEVMNAGVSVCAAHLRRAGAPRIHTGWEVDALLTITPIAGTMRRVVPQ